MSRHIRVSDARAVGKFTDADGVVIIEFAKDGQLAMASYGRSRYRCQQLGQWLDKRMDELQSGLIESPWDERVEQPRCKQTADMFGEQS
tara:strand:+ start:2948 stop:3214 length:267 start_codon:yes stop_codon:yes gene_type:complete